MPLVEENWQSTRSTIRERTKFMLNNDLFSDVKFVVRKSDGESESKQMISAHKFVLSIGSPVFEAMFYGELADTRDSIELPDCEYESLFELFRFMYSDEVNLSGINVMGVLYLAKKYMVPSLADKCTEYLHDNLDPSNVFSILPSAEKYEDKLLVDRCWKVVDRKTEAAMKSDGFATIGRSLLEALVERDTLNIAEVELFKGVVEWAKNESEKRGSATDGQEKRRILGERIVKAIRFPVMKQKEFITVVLDHKILTLAEVTNLIKHFNSSQNSPVGFPVAKRSGPSTSDLMRCSRFSSVKFRWGSRNNNRLDFSVDSGILFHGVSLFGSEGNTYSVGLTLSSSLSVLVSTQGKFSSVPYASREYYGFEVLFEVPVYLKKGVEYHIVADISGPDSWYGTQGRSTLHCAGVTFTLNEPFRPSYKGYSFSGGTGVTQGQFNEFIFSL